MSFDTSRRGFIRLGGASVLGLGSMSLLSACGGSASGTGSAAGGSIKVGLLGPYSGSLAKYGLAVRSGAELYAKQANGGGGINGKQIELEALDERGDGAEATNAYRKLVTDGVVAVLGDVTSAPAIAVAQASAADNMPLVSASASATAVVAYGPNAFRTCATDPFQGRLLADVAADEGYGVVATVFNASEDYEVGVEYAFVQEAKAKGLAVSSEQGFMSGDTDFSTQLTTILATDPDAILVPNYCPEDGKIVTQARQMGYRGVFLGADGWSGITDYASAQDLEGCLYACSFAASEDERVQRFVSDYKAEYGEDPGNFDALGYDAAMVILGAIRSVEEGGGAEYGTDDYRQAIIAAIASSTVEGVTGTIRYNGTGDPVRPTTVLRFEGGAQKVYKTIGA